MIGGDIMEMGTGYAVMYDAFDRAKRFVFFVIATIAYSYLITLIDANYLFDKFYSEVFRYNIAFIFIVGYVCFVMGRPLIGGLYYANKGRSTAYELIGLFIVLVIITVFHFTISQFTDYNKVTIELSKLEMFVNTMLLIFLSILPYQIYADYLKKLNLPK